MIEKLNHSDWQDIPLDDFNRLIDKVNEIAEKVNALERFCSRIGIEDAPEDIRRIIE